MGRGSAVPGGHGLFDQAALREARRAEGQARGRGDGLLLLGSGRSLRVGERLASVGGKVETVDTIDEKIVSFSAAKGDQISGTMDSEGHGAFTYYLLKGLGGEARDASSQVTVKSLYDYLSPKVADAARRQNRDQTPQLMRASGRDSQRLR